MADVRAASLGALALLLLTAGCGGEQVGVDAEGPGGARLELRTRSETELRILAQASGTCERQELPLP
ncbi:MAG: hypothetical protein LH477_01050 [Nocardioides sp.]|nr:hypothetical protein [Nocardioides sp.]